MFLSLLLAAIIGSSISYLDALMCHDYGTRKVGSLIHRYSSRDFCLLARRHELHRRGASAGDVQRWLEREKKSPSSRLTARATLAIADLLAANARTALQR
eukprot:1136618-Pelagomonas_calceolata.AAC.1